MTELTELQRIRGWAEFVLRDAEGNIKVQFEQPNTITTLGHAMANGRISNQGSYGVCTVLALGIGTGGTTTLNSEITTAGGARATAVATQVTTTNASDTTQLVYTWTFSGPFAITEEGIVDSTTVAGSHLLAYQTFSAINVVNTDQLTVTHKYQT